MALVGAAVLFLVVVVAEEEGGRCSPTTSSSSNDSRNMQVPIEAANVQSCVQWEITPMRTLHEKKVPAANATTTPINRMEERRTKKRILLGEESTRKPMNKSPLLLKR